MMIKYRCGCCAPVRHAKHKPGTIVVTYNCMDHKRGFSLKTTITTVKWGKYVLFIKKPK